MGSNTILVADDLNDRSTKGRIRSRVIRANAVELAKGLSAKVELLFIPDLGHFDLKKKDIPAFLESFSVVKSSVESQFSKEKIPGKVKLKVGVPAEEILTEEDLLPDVSLLVIGTQGKTGLKKILLGSVAEEVIRKSKVPTLVIGPVAQKKQSTVKLNKNLRVLLLTDFGDASGKAESFALNLCKELHCSVTIAHSIGDQIMRIRESFYTTGYVPFNIENMLNQMVEDAQRLLLEKEKSWKKQGLDVTSVLIEKEEGLEKSIKAKYFAKTDLIIMGTHGRNKVLMSFLGSRARKLILESPVPVMVVRNQTE